CTDSNQVIANRIRLAASTLPLERWALACQEHTDVCRPVNTNDLGKGTLVYETGLPACDALYTTQPDVLIGVMTADCVGILLTDPTTPCLAAIHSGWPGTLASITKKTVASLIRQGLLHPETTTAFFSPSILFSSFEVGMDLVDRFIERGFDLEGCVRQVSEEKAYLDNQGLNEKMLKECGITKIHLSKIDTKTHPDLCFSYRNKDIGRHFTYGYIKGSSR
ncbi:MAG: laccase domain-containing protein, partial [Erysipelotrichaceae bacterium]|nr:laccase domain-containing protein [Erysipelotrichaceae bacterium]